MLVIETGKDQNCQYNETIFTPRALGLQCRENRAVRASQSKQEFYCHCAKGSLPLPNNRGSKAYYLFPLRKVQKMSYKSWLWQWCKYLYSQARLRVTAEDIWTGELRMEPFPAQHVNSIFIFLPRSISPSIFPAADHTCIFITDLWLSEPRKPQAPKASVTAPWSLSEAHNNGLMTVVLQKWEVMSADARASCLERPFVTLCALL